jgi:hypothetical protein
MLGAPGPARVADRLDPAEILAHAEHLLLGRDNGRRGTMGLTVSDGPVAWPCGNLDGIGRELGYSLGDSENIDSVIGGAAGQPAPERIEAVNE